MEGYSYLHPMVAGVVLFAFGLKTTLSDVRPVAAIVLLASFPPRGPCRRRPRLGWWRP